MFSTSSDTTLTCPVAATCPWSETLSRACARTTLCLPSSPPHQAALTSIAITRKMRTKTAIKNGSDEDRACSARGFHASSSRNSSCGAVVVGAHPEMKLVRETGEESSGGVEMWDATVAGGGSRCKRRVAVKKMTLTEEMDVDWMQG